MYRLRDHIPFIILFSVLLVTGLIIYKDYGISWDEGMQRNDNGLVNYNYIHNNDYESLINGNEKYHGPAFEIALIYIEKAFALKSTREIYLMRHLVTFLVFFISVYFFYRISYEELRDTWIALAGTTFLILSPRIFADAFYNSKDLVFMSFIIINIYSAIRFLKNPGIGTAIFHALITAIVIDTRVMGVIVPGFTIALILYSILFRSMRAKKVALPVVIYFIFLIGFTIMFWPVLWKEPLHHFIASIEEMSHYHWGSYLIYLGKPYDTTFIPWHYIPVWMGVTTPLLYLLLFITGLAYIIYKFVKRKLMSDFEIINILLFFVPLLAVIVLKSVVYDGWRHLFFIYPSMLLIASSGLKVLYDRLKHNSLQKKIFTGGILVYCFYILIVIIRLHPYENIYFNSIAGNSLNVIRKNFEIDYWGLSYKELLQFIKKSDSSSLIFICPAENPGRDNLKILTDDERIRFSITTRPELSDYYITTYRYQHEMTDYPTLFNVERNGVIASVFDLRSEKVNLSNEAMVSSHYYDYDNPVNDWGAGNIHEVEGALSGNTVEILDSVYQYGSALSIYPPVQFLRDSMRNYVMVSVYVRSDAPLEFRLVLQVDSANGDMKHWDGMEFEVFRQGKWTRFQWATLLPKSLSESDRIKIYAWNFKKHIMQVDDSHIQFYSVPEEHYRRLKREFPMAFIRDRD